MPGVARIETRRAGRWGDNMPLTITDDMLTSAGLSEQEAKLEIACRLYDAGRLNMPQATRWAGVDRTACEAALLERGLPLVRFGDEYWQQELDGMQQLGWSPRRLS